MPAPCGGGGAVKFRVPAAPAASSPLANGAGIGALGEAAAGGIIGATVGAPGVGAAVGGALRLGAGAGVQLQIQENKQPISSANRGRANRKARDRKTPRLPKGEY